MQRILTPTRLSHTARVVSVFFATVLLVSMAHAQASAGSISGTVSDPTGAAVPNATVSISNQATGVSRALITNGSGFYSAEGLDVGEYRVSIKVQGFTENTTQHIQIDPGTRRANNVTLQVGSSSTQVNVSAAEQQVNTESSESGGTIGSEQIDNLMLNGRNFQTLAIAIPGVSSTSGADSLTGGGLLGGTTLIVNGNSVEYTTYTIDGAYNMNQGNLSDINIVPIVDGISEFSVLKDNYSAKYGFAGSGQVIVQTKSGTETFHGSAWDYLRNNAFDANNYFTTTTQALHQNIYGYTLGGPVVLPRLYNTNRSKKTFFFASNQWLNVNAGQVARGAVFPQAIRNGDFSASPTLSGALALDAHSQALLASEGKTNCILGPTSLNPQCFDPVAVALLNAYVPLPNNPGGGFLNYLNQGDLTTRQLDYQFRVDHAITKNHQLMVRYLSEPVTNGFPYDTWGGLPYSTITDQYYTGNLNALVKENWIITPQLLNSFNIVETYDKVRITTTKGGTLPSGVSMTQAFPSVDQYNRIPNIAISGGWSGNGVQSEPIIAPDAARTLSDDVSWVKGKHVLQFGGLWLLALARQNTFTSPQGSFSFTGIHSGDPAADYLLGLDATYQQANAQRYGSFHWQEGDIYAQDDWKAARRLTLNLGVRWVYLSATTISGNQVTSFSPGTFNPAQAPMVNVNGSLQVNGQNQPITATGQPANLLNGLVAPGQNGVPNGFYNPPKHNFGPRVGFAYDLFGNGKTSIRGGYGIGYQQFPTRPLYDAFANNPPYNQNANVLNSLLSNGTAGTSGAPTTQTLTNVPAEYTPTNIQSYSLTVEHQFGSSLIASLAYAGSQGRHLSLIAGTLDLNFPLPVSAPSAAGCLPAGQAPSTSYDFDPCINAGVASPDYTRPYKGDSAIGSRYDEGSSNYNSLQSSVKFRQGRSEFSVAYTYSKSLATVGGHGAGATTSQGVAPQNPRDFRVEYGPPDYDFTNDLTATWVYRIPLFSHATKLTELALGNWSVTGLAIHQSGFALSPSLATNNAGEAIRPNQIGSYRKVGRLNEWFDTSRFAAPAAGFFGDASNGVIRGPGYNSVNVGLYKDFPLHERFKLEFKAEAYNLANHPNFSNVSTGYGSANFGQVTSARDPRILEFALKLMF